MQQFTYVRKALKSWPGKPPLVWLGPHPRHRAAMSPPITCVDGSGMQPLPAMSARSRRTFLTCHPRPERCCCRRLARIPHVPSTCCLRTRRSSSLARSSGYSCCVGYACLSRWRPGTAIAAASLTLGATIVQPAQLLGCWARAIRLERALARVCRKAGARVAQNVRLADKNLDASVQDARRIEVLCNGLPLWHGAQLAVDATIVSPVGRTGEPRAGADARPALALDQAAQRKRRHTYPEFKRARRCRLVVFGVEVGGRWSREAAQFVRLLARARAAAALAALRVTARGAWVQRWSGILSVAAQRAFATSLLELPLHGECQSGSLEPELHEVLADSRWTAAPGTRSLSKRM